MNVEEFTQATEQELRHMANERLTLMETAGSLDRAGYLLEAQLYLSELGRREDARVAHRDVILEGIVIGLIGLEIILGVVGIAVGIREGNQQAGILQKLNDSAGDTAKAMRFLVQQQEKSANTQSKTLDTISTMNSAMQNQLAILKKDQRQRLAELAKKPELQVILEGVPITSAMRPILPHEFTATKLTYEIMLRNVGEATAKAFTLMVGTENPNVSLSADTGFINLREPSTLAGKAILIGPLERLLPQQWVVLNISAAYPPRTKQFTLTFSASGDNIFPTVVLGAIQIRPPGTQIN